MCLGVVARDLGQIKESSAEHCSLGSSRNISTCRVEDIAADDMLNHTPDSLNHIPGKYSQLDWIARYWVESYSHPYSEQT